MKYDVKDLNEINIIEVAIALGLSVKSKKALCFLHADKNPSLSFNTANNTWKCFGCGQGGNVIELVKKANKAEFKEACHWLACHFKSVDYYGSTSIVGRYNQNEHTQNTKRSIELEPDNELYSVLISNLSLSEKAEKYLCEKRALSIDVIKANNIISLDNVPEVYKWLRTNFAEERLIKAGLVQKNESGYTYDFWRTPGIIFPYFDISKKVVNLQLRPYEPSNKQKYIFLKGIKTCMYNESALADLAWGEEVFLCEGAIDVLSLLTMGFMAVGIPGVATVKDEWIEILRRFKVGIVFDNDIAGKTNAEKCENNLKERNINVRRYNVSKYNDVNEKLQFEKGVSI